MKLHYVEAGRGPAVLLVHAFPLNHTMWASQIDALKDRFRVIAPDIRGFGQSATDSPWTLAQAADDLAELLDTLSVSDCALVGLSMGGYIGLPFYAKYANRVRRLILADTRARADNEAEKKGRTDLVAALEQSGAGILADRVLPRLLKPEPSPSASTQVRGIIAAASAKAAIFASQAMRDRADATPVLSQISCPTLVIAGEEDAITRVDECRAMAETIQAGRFVMIPGAGHLSNIENAEAFNAAVSAFLA